VVAYELLLSLGSIRIAPVRVNIDIQTRGAICGARCQTQEGGECSRRLTLIGGIVKLESASKARHGYFSPLLWLICEYICLWGVYYGPRRVTEDATGLCRTISWRGVSWAFQNYIWAEMHFSCNIVVQISISAPP